MRQFRRGTRFIMVVGTVLSLVPVPVLARQPAAPTPGSRAAVPAPVGQVAPGADLRQLMIGIFYPASNVVFAAQDDLSTFKQAEDAASSPNPLTSIYNGWQAVQDAALALNDAANLLLLPDRVCSNGQPAPLQRPDWDSYVQILREAAMASYRAAQSKSQDAMVQVSGFLSNACDACHKAYRDKYKAAGKVCLP